MNILDCFNWSLILPIGVVYILDIASVTPPWLLELCSDKPSLLYTDRGHVGGVVLARLGAGGAGASSDAEAARWRHHRAGCASSQGRWCWAVSPGSCSGYENPISSNSIQWSTVQYKPLWRNSYLTVDSYSLQISHLLTFGGSLRIFAKKKPRSFKLLYSMV